MADEIQLLQASKDGDTAAFEQIVNKYQSLVCAITFSGTGRVDISEELAQDTFLSAWKKLSQLKELAGFQAWICSIARNMLNNYYRRKKTVSLESAGIAEITDTAPLPSENLINQEEHTMLEQALMQIPAEYREPLVMYYRQQKSTRQVAIALNLNESTVRTRLHRAKQMLRDQIAEGLEQTIEKTAPDKTFTKAVMLAVAGSAVGISASATAATTTAATTSITTILSTMTAKIITAAAVAVIAAGTIIYTQSNKPNQTPQPSDQATSAQTIQQPVTTPANIEIIKPSDKAIAAKTIDNPGEATTGSQNGSQAASVNETLSNLKTTDNIEDSEFVFKPKGILSGLITDADSLEPVEYAEVSISNYSTRKFHKSKTDKNGMYFFEDTINEGSYEISVQTDDHITPDRWNSDDEYVLLAKDNQFVKHFEFEKGCRIELHVFDEQGVGIKGVRINAAYMSDDNGRGPRKDPRRDKNGNLVIGGLRQTEYFVTVMHRDYAPTYEKFQFEKSEEVKSMTVTLKKGISVDGRAICSDGLPASGWKISATPKWWNSTSSIYKHHKIDKEGYFTLEHVLPGNNNIIIRIPKDGGSQGLWSTAMTLPLESDLLELTIPKPSPHGRVSISGKINFIDGTPSQGSWIDAHSNKTSYYSSVYLKKGETDFVLKDLVPDLYEIDFGIRSANGEKIVYHNIPAPSEGLVFDLQLNHSKRDSVVLKAKVIDKETSEPVPQFKIKKYGDTSWREISDQEGLFEIQLDNNKEWKILVEAEGYAIKTIKQLDANPDEPMVIALGICGAIEGFVVNENGKPIKDALINYRYNHSRSREPDAKFITKTDTDGFFIIENLSENISLYSWYEVKHPEYVPEIVYLDIEEGYVTETQIVLQKGGTIEGYVYDHNGLPLLNETLYFLSESQYSYWTENRSRLGSAVTDKNGYYSVKNLPEKLCYGFRSKPDDKLGMVLGTGYPENGKTVRLDFGGQSCASGRLLNDGKPMNNIKLIIVGNEIGWEQAFKAYGVTDADGRFAFRGIPSGQRKLYWAIPGLRNWDCWSQLGEFVFEKGTDLDLDDFDLCLSEAIIQVNTEKPDKSMEQLQVYIYSYDENNFDNRQKQGLPLSRHQQNDPYTFTFLVPGLYEAIGKRPGHLTSRKTFEITTEKQTYVDLWIPSGSASVSGKVISPDLNSSQTRLKLRSVGQELTMEFRPSTDGSFAIKNLPPDSYIIGPSSVINSRESNLKEFDLAANEHKEINIEMNTEIQKKQNISGYLVASIITEHGLPVPGVEIWLERGSEIIKPRFNLEGKTSFAGEPGQWTLRADYPGYKPIRQTVTIKDRQSHNTQELLKPVIIKLAKESLQSQ